MTTGGCSAEDWDYEVRVSKLEASVNMLVKQVAELSNSNLETKAELKVAREMLKKSMARNETTSWELHRVEVVLPKVRVLLLLFGGSKIDRST